MNVESTQSSQLQLALDAFLNTMTLEEAYRGGAHLRGDGYAAQRGGRARRGAAAPDRGTRRV